MKRLSLTCALVFAAALPARSQDVEGAFELPLENGGKTQIEFTARATSSSGRGAGTLKFSTRMDVTDVDGENSSGEAPPTAELSLDVDVDCVVVQSRRAAISGIVRRSSLDEYAGRRVVMTVEDGGEGADAQPDKYTWGIYRRKQESWIATDGEVADDPGEVRRWTASDAELEDDPGAAGTKDEAETDCRTFKFGSVGMTALPPDTGNIQVRP